MQAAMNSFNSPDPALAAEISRCTPLVTLSFLKRARACVKLLQTDGELRYMTENGMCAMEIEDHDAIRGQKWWDLWPDEARPQLRDAVTRARLGERVSFEADCPTAGGTPKSWDVALTPVRDEDGKVVYILSVSREIGLTH